MTNAGNQTLQGVVEKWEPSPMRYFNFYAVYLLIFKHCYVHFYS